MKKVLVTAFDPFDGEPVNPALEAVKRLEQQTFEDLTVVTQEIPTVFHKSLAVLRQAMIDHKPDLVLCVGQAGGRSEISVERVAINVDDARIADNEGNAPVDAPIVPDGPVAYWSTLPIKAIVQAIREQGIPASVSQTAGTYVCNHLFYGLSHLIATEFPHVRGGFLHIPFLPEQTARRYAGQPSMCVENVLRALVIAIDTSANCTEDVKIGGGQIS